MHDSLATRRHIHLVDLRNHGESDHHASMTYSEMCDDIIRFADSREMQVFTAAGHGMGGKLAMTLACKFPDRVDGVISLDAAP